MSLGDWIITLVVLSIPVVGLIMMLVWAFSSGTNPNKANYCKAALIFFLILIVLFFLLGGMAILGGLSSLPATGM